MQDLEQEGLKVCSIKVSGDKETGLVMEDVATVEHDGKASLEPGGAVEQSGEMGDSLWRLVVRVTQSIKLLQGCPMLLSYRLEFWQRRIHQWFTGLPRRSISLIRQKRENCQSICRICLIELRNFWPRIWQQGWRKCWNLQMCLRRLTWILGGSQLWFIISRLAKHIQSSNLCGELPWALRSRRGLCWIKCYLPEWLNIAILNELPRLCLCEKGKGHGGTA